MYDILFLTAVFITAVIVSSVISMLPFKKSEEIAALIFITILFGVPIYNYTAYRNEIVGHKDIKIYSTGYNSLNQVSGNFILGTGTINSQEVYLANVKTGKNRFERLYIPVLDTVRIIDSNLTDYAIYRVYYCQITYPFTPPDKEEECRLIDDNIRNELYIPKKAIVKQLVFN